MVNNFSSNPGRTPRMSFGMPRRILSRELTLYAEELDMNPNKVAMA